MAVVNTSKISIVTVVLNAANEIKKTIRSVLDQDWPQVEYIIIDGGSTDGTVEVIKAHAGQISYCISEPDHGIFEAMNKGLGRATGEWVNFMNAGDVFFDHNVLSCIFNQDIGDAEVIYGDSIAHYPHFKVIRKAQALNNLWKGMICCHQSMFFRTNLIKSSGFRSDLDNSADYEMVLRLFISGKEFRYVPLNVSVFDTRGISNLEMGRSARSNLKIFSSFRKPTLKEKLFHRRFICQSKLTDWIYQYLPANVINLFLKWYYRQQIIHE